MREIATGRESVEEKGLIEALNRIAPRAFEMRCIGCEQENDCYNRGCAIILEAAERLRKSAEKAVGNRRS